MGSNAPGAPGKAWPPGCAPRSPLPWERAFAALDQGKICGYCTLAARDCIPGITYTPFVGYVFVEEGYRGHRLSQRLIQAALQEAKRLGYPAVYFISDHEGLYEKYGFVPVDAAPAPWNPGKNGNHLPL